MAGTMNIGLRHVLPIYPFMAMLAAVAVANLWQLRVSPSLAYSVRAGVVLLLVWNLAELPPRSPRFCRLFQ